MMIEFRKLSWWLWLVSAVLIGLGIFVTPKAFACLIALSAFQIVLYAVLDKSLTSFPVQVRAAYFLIVLTAYAEPIRWIYWIPFIGTTAIVVTGYCPLARMLSLLPWNRKEPFTLDLVRRTFFSKPVRGNILQGLPPA